MTTREIAAVTPLGHWLSSHGLFGWCALCPGRSGERELAAWRGWARVRVLSRPSLPVPDEVRRVDGCSCRGGDRVHADGCELLLAGSKEAYDAAVAAAARRGRAFSLGIMARDEALWVPVERL